MSSSDNELRCHLKCEIYTLKILYPVQASSGRNASNNISHDNEILLLVAAFFSPMSSFWESTCSSSGHVMGSKYSQLT